MHNEGDGDMTMYSSDLYPGIQVNEEHNSVQVQSYDPINP